jgi:hypothetical protein
MKFTFQQQSTRPPLRAVGPHCPAVQRARQADGPGEGQSRDPPLGARGRPLVWSRWTSRSAIRRRSRWLPRRTPWDAVLAGGSPPDRWIPSGTGVGTSVSSPAFPSRGGAAVGPGGAARPFRIAGWRLPRPCAIRCRSRTRAALFSRSQRAVEPRATTITREVARMNPMTLTVAHIMTPTPGVAADVPVLGRPPRRTEGPPSRRRRQAGGAPHLRTRLSGPLRRGRAGRC